MRKIVYRIHQFIMRIGSYFVPWRKPIVIEGNNSLERLPLILLEKNYNRVLIVTDKNLYDLNLLDTLINGLDKLNIHYSIYNKTIVNPTIKNVEEALSKYIKHDCNTIIAFGGGSPIDCAKGVAARLARPKKTIKQLRGFIKVRRKTIPLIAIPTTAGSGSETTIAAVISDCKTHKKFAISDMALIPSIAVLDPKLTINLPKHITATTGMDALTHAIEAYLGRANTKETKMMAIKAIKLIFDNLEVTYNEPDNIDARMNMLKASYMAGVSFTRAYVGYVHALAHQLGGMYDTPHGLANAVLLPEVLIYYGTSIHRKLAKLAEITLDIDRYTTREQKVNIFINKIITMNSNMKIPTKIKGIKEEDLNVMVERAYKEANPHYPVPKILNKKDLKKIYRKIM